MKTTKLILTVLTIASLMMAGAPAAISADDTIKIGEIHYSIRIEVFVTDIATTHDRDITVGDE